VLLTIDASALNSTEHIKELYLNYNSATLPATFSTFSATPNGTVNQPTYSTGANAFKADGDGFFDLVFTFDQGGAGRLNGGETVSLLILNATEGLFNVLSFGGGNSPNGLYVAAHIGGIGPNGQLSGWVTVPEPTTVVAGALLLLPFAASTMRFIRKRKA
jgi:hypothetical protein